MAYLVDGHNLIPHIPGLQLSDPDDELALIQRLQTFCRTARREVVVVFDQAPPGWSGPTRHGCVQVVFAPTHSTADEVIRQRLARLKGSAQNWTVVSSDRRVQAEARAVRARVQPSDAFARELAAAQMAGVKQAAADGKLDAAEVNEWLALFREAPAKTHKKDPRDVKNSRRDRP